jgi:RNA polymerase sigma-70 factor (ECF subfamily)
MDATVIDSTATRQLLTRLQAGEPGALDQLFAQHRAYLHQVIDLRLDEQTRRRMDTSDVVQETQLEAAGRIDEYLERQPMPFRVWLRKTAHEQLAKARQRHVVAKKRSVRREVAWPHHSTLQLAQRLLGGRSTPSEQAARRELAERVRRAISELEELDREIILMLDIEGLSSPQAGYVLEMEPAAVRRRHTRALLKVHKILRAGGLTESQL